MICPSTNHSISKKQKLYIIQHTGPKLCQNTSQNNQKKKRKGRPLNIKERQNKQNKTKQIPKQNPTNIKPMISTNNSSSPWCFKPCICSSSRMHATYIFFRNYFLFSTQQLLCMLSRLLTRSSSVVLVSSSFFVK